VTRVLLATCAALPDGDEDGAALSSALAGLGVQSRWCPWTSPVEWDDALVVIRSTWDYTDRRTEFLGWAHSVPRLANSAQTLEWNSDKTYLRDLADAGIAITPTEWLTPGLALEQFGYDEVVVKPSVGAGSRGAGRFRAAQAAAARKHVRALHDAGRTVLLQPYLAGVDDTGEAALIYLDGVFSHAVTKAAMLPPDVVHGTDAAALFVAERITARTVSDAERAVADAALSVVTDRFGCPLYARVDLLPAPYGPVVVEVEVIEPSLFLSHSPGAAKRFAAAIAARA
jgi:glutathione synthase/RimK-type ligase-like ATP-grasp enzyme